MSSWQGKSRGNKLGYRIFIWILRNAGVFPAYFLLRFVAFYFFLFSRKSSKPLLHVYQNRLSMGWFKAWATIYSNYRLLGQGIIDKIVIMSGIKNRFTFNFDGEEHIRTMIAGGKGGMLLSGHIGNWDIAGHLLKRMQTRINIVLFDGEHAQIKEYLEAIVGPKSMHIIVIKEDLSHIYQISEAFQNNELVCMHADRFLPGNKTLATEFLGGSAHFPMGPFLLAATFKVPVCYVFAAKESNLHYHLFSSKPFNYQHLRREQAIQQMLLDFTDEMEVKVRRYPAQWFNYYNFWAVPVHK